MKRAFAFVVPFALAFVLSSARADDKEGTWTVTVGCAHCSYEKESGASSCAPAAKAGDKVYVLKGDAVKGLKFKQGGEYKVTGKISADGKTIDVAKIDKA